MYRKSIYTDFAISQVTKFVANLYRESLLKYIVLSCRGTSRQYNVIACIVHALRPFFGFFYYNCTINKLMGKWKSYGAMFNLFPSHEHLSGMTLRYLNKYLRLQESKPKQ